MKKFDFHNLNEEVTPPTIIPLLKKVKGVYILWYGYYQILPKDHRHSLGQRIDTLFIEIIESMAIASFLSKEEKQPWIRIAIRKTDTLKILLMVLWETKSLDNKKYVAVSTPLNEIGKMLGGWNGQVTKKIEEVKVTPINPVPSKQNSPGKKPEEK